MTYRPIKTEVIPDVFWVGVNDWSIRNFHGYHTDEGSSYNSYMIMDEHPTLVDTVKYPFVDEYLERIQSVCKLEDIEFLVMNHAEGDHSSALPIVITKMPKAQIVTTQKCKDTLQILYPSLKEHEKWLIVDAKSTVNIGKRDLTFIPVPMVHWPEQIVTYCAQDECLFSNDAFGQHLATTERWADQLPLERVMHLVREYNANILGAVPHLIKKVLETAETISIKQILTAHGVGWRGDSIKEVIGEYARFSQLKYNKKVTIVFDSMYCSTSKAAIAIAEGVKSTGALCQVLDLKANDLTKVALHMYDSKCFAFGSPTLNATMMPTVEGAIGWLRGLKLLNKKYGVAFGAFGWAAAGVKEMSEALVKCGAEVEETKLQWKFQVNEEVLSKAFELGVKLGNRAIE